MDNNSLEIQLKKHHQDAYLWSCQCCYYQEEEAKDVLQQVYVKIIEGKANYTEKSSFKTWLFAIIRFTAIDHMKQQSRFTSLDDIKMVTVEYTPDHPAIDYRNLLLQLPERQQQVLLLAFYHEMTLASIAAVTQLHIGTVRTHYERGKTTLKQLILNEKTYRYG